MPSCRWCRWRKAEPLNFDPRITPARPDLAAAHLRGKVEAARFAEGTEQEVIVGIAPLRKEPSHDAPLAHRGAVRRARDDLRDRRGRLGLGPARIRRLCRLAAGGGAARAGRRADAQGRGAADPGVPRPVDQAAADWMRCRSARRSPWRGEQESFAVTRVRRLRAEAASCAARDGRAGFRRGGRAFRRRALSLGRQVEPRHRLLGAGAGRADGVRHQLPARQRHAGERARQARKPRRPAKRRPDLLERPRRHRARPQQHDPRQRLPHGGGDRARGRRIWRASAPPAARSPA